MSGARTGRRVVLIFHGIGDAPRWVPSHERRFWCPRREWPGIADALADASLTGSSVEVTFDDGNASDVVDALPALLERGLTATFNICAGRIGRPGYLDEQALLHVREAGMTIGSHGWDHVDLRTLPRAELVHETRDSRDRIAEACEGPVTAFAVPFGSYDRRVLRHLRSYSTVYTSDATSTRGRPWLVPRWTYVRGWTPATVSHLVHEGELPRHRLRQRTAMVVKRWR
ncbi:MAG: polysaccharide deacetylase family protein [Dermatophilaceae bacterium]